MATGTNTGMVVLEASMPGRCSCHTSDDGAQAAPGSRFGVGKHVVRHAVGRDHTGLMADAKLLENLHRVLHGVPVGAGAHHDFDLNR